MLEKGDEMITKFLKVFLVLFLFAAALGGLISTCSTITINNTPIEQEIPLTEEGKKIKEKFPTWSNDICNAVAKNRIRIGMTEEQVKASWGKPYRINTTMGAWGSSEQWVMRDSIHTDFLYFNNGVLVSIQRTR